LSPKGRGKENTGKVDIKKIKELCSQSKIKWSGHASERIQQRGISREDVINCIMGGEIIEEYPEHENQKGVLIMCFYCKGDMNPSTTTHVVNYNGCLIVIKNVPCEECDQCGEVEYSDEVMQKLEMIVNNAKQLLQEFSIIDYAKVA